MPIHEGRTVTAEAPIEARCRRFIVKVGCSKYILMNMDSLPEPRRNFEHRRLVLSNDDGRKNKLFQVDLQIPYLALVR